MASEIWVIGTDPPCPRCALVARRVKLVLEQMGIDVPLRHLSFDNPQARQFAASLGQDVGTAKDVARTAGIEMDMDAISQIIARQWMVAAKRLKCSLEDVPPADRWSPELDEALRPLEEEAKRIGFMMTPVLVIDGVIKHQGSVPGIEEIRIFLGQMKAGEIAPDRHI